jgi:hypothetical protein
MPRVLFLVNLLEDGVYRCHVRVAFDSAHKLQKFLSRHPVREKDGWETLILKGPSRGYDGKPLYHADIWLFTRLPLPEPPPRPSAHEPADFMVSDDRPQVDYAPRANASEQKPEVKEKNSLTWEQRAALQKASKALLRQLGVSDLGRGR